MIFTENIAEALRAIKGNRLRTVLTGMIIAIGIMALVGILTAVDSIQASIDSSLSELGAKSFDIKQKGSRGRRRGVEEKVYPPISYAEAKRFKELYPFSARISISSWITGSAEAKYGSRKTNPNTGVVGGDENYLLANGLNLSAGRNFSTIELDYGVNVAIIGYELAETLFRNEDPIQKEVSLLGRKFKVIGVLEKAGGGLLGGNSSDRRALIPLQNVLQLMRTATPSFEIVTITNLPSELDYAMSEATGIMRIVRRDALGQPDSFELSRSESLATAMNDISGVLRLAGFGIGFITLMGASIGLMNIMMVTVTERTREIGVRKALGATPGLIRQQFLVEAIVICQLGGIVGVIFGIGIGNVVSLLIESGKFIIPWIWIITAFVVCGLVGILSGYYPAYKASKLDPIESLRYE